jgi:hypothetical protein
LPDAAALPLVSILVFFGKIPPADFVFFNRIIVAASSLVKLQCGWKTFESLMSVVGGGVLQKFLILSQLPAEFFFF